MKRLEAAAIPPAVREAIQRLQGAGHEVFVVGGVVRDLLLGRGLALSDWDLATRASPAQVQGVFARVVPTGIAHGTVTVLLGGEALEVTTYRGEAEYSDGRRPDAVRFLDRIEDDLARRDFTVNAMAWNPLSGDLRDPHDGRGDLQGRLLRAVGNPRRRFAEDGLRPLRAVRFSAVLDFALEPGTLAAIPETLEVYAQVSMERLAAELRKLLCGVRVDRGLSLLRETGLWRRLVPEALRGLPEASALFENREVLRRLPSREIVRYAGFLRPVGSAAAVSTLVALRESRALQQAVGLLIAVFEEGVPDPADDQVLRKRLAQIETFAGPEGAAEGLLEALCALYEEMGGEEGSAASLALREEAARGPPLTVRALAISGSEVMALLGRGAGPAVGETLRALLGWVLEDPTRNQPEILKEQVRSLSTSRPSTVSNK